MSSLLDNFNYIVCVILLVLGLWAMIAKSNLIKKCIGLGIFQTAIILFYISMGAKKGATIPILEHHVGDAHHAVINPAHYANPLTQILMLTAIVVGVATLGVALALVQRIYQQHGSIEEDDIKETINS